MLKKYVTSPMVKRLLVQAIAFVLILAIGLIKGNATVYSFGLGGIVSTVFISGLVCGCDMLNLIENHNVENIMKRAYQ